MIISHFRCAPIDCKYFLFKTYCMPLYGVQLVDLNCKYSQPLFVAWRKAIRRLFELPYTTHCNLLPLICQDTSVEQQIDKRLVAFLNMLSRSPNRLVKTCYSITLNGNLSPTSNSVSVLCHRYNVSRINVHNIKINDDYAPYDAPTQVAAFILDLLTCLQSPLPKNTRDDFTDILHHLCTQ
jgi:hypothetical protein